MMLVELAVAVLLLGIALFLLAGLVRTTRQQAKRDLTVRLLCALDGAVSAYAGQHGVPPPGQPDGSAARALAALLACERSRAPLANLPPVLRRTHDESQTLVDAWGNPLRYVTSLHASADLRARVATNRGKPIFDSAGPDGQFEPNKPRTDGFDVWGDECVLESRR